MKNWSDMEVTELQDVLDGILDQPMLDGDDLDRRIPTLVEIIVSKGGKVDETRIRLKGAFLGLLGKAQPETTEA